MLNLTQRLWRWLSRDRVTELAERVAGRSRLAVWQRVMDRLPELGPTEARGYMRARAAAIIHEETGRLIDQEGPKLVRLREQIEEAALGMLIQTIAAQVAPQRRQSTSRRAA